jgi:hypothetical protein
MVLPPSDDTLEPGPLWLLPGADVGELLLQHAGPGGVAAARHLADPTLPADLWYVLLCASDIRLSAYGRSQRNPRGLHRTLLSVTLAYDADPERPMPTRGKVLKDEGLSLMNSGGADGPAARPHGRSSPDAVLARPLVAMVWGHPNITPLPNPEQGGAPVWVRVTTDLVANLLESDYSHQPAAVAEAIRILRRVCPRNAGWLERLLLDRPGLQQLSCAVKVELTSEAPTAEA